MAETQSICSWLQAQTVLITGGNGFLGQSLIYKLLQCGCPRIFVLLRAKKGKGVQERFYSLISCKVFKNIDKNDIKRRLIPIAFDSSQVGLGLSEEDANRFQKEVTAVFHELASVRFDDPLKVAVNTNMRITRDLLELAKTFHKLKIFVHVSTTFSNCEDMEKGIEERVYERKMDWKSLLTVTETLPEEVLNGLEKKLLGSSPNTYIFTKHLAESMVSDYAHELPVVIFRPPIVIMALQEPYIGWFISMNSPMAIAISTGMGVLRVLPSPPDVPLAYLPVDCVTNGTLVLAWYHSTQERSNIVPVINSNYFPASVRYLCDSQYAAREVVPMRNSLWYPFLSHYSNRFVYLAMFFLLQLLPGFLIDGMLKLKGDKPRLMKLYRVAFTALNDLKPFMSFFHNVIHEKYEEIVEKIPDSEKNVFYTDHKIPEMMVPGMIAGTAEFRVMSGAPREPSPEDFAAMRRSYPIHLAFKTFLIATALWYFPYSILFSIRDAVWNYFSIIFEENLV